MNSKKNDWKKREGVVYSTDAAFEYRTSDASNVSALPNGDQNLVVSLDRRGRNGKQVTVVSGFVGGREDLEDLARRLKSRCATGGSVKDGEILIQGDFRERVVEYLSKAGYRAKRRG